MKIILATCVLFFVAVTGCTNSVRLAPVEGTVTLDGKPLATGNIVFETGDARPATAEIKEGKIVNWESGGVPVGSHKVSITANEEVAAATPANPGDVGSGSLASMSGKSLIPAKYGDPRTSGLTATVKAGLNQVEFKLQSEGE